MECERKLQLIPTASSLTVSQLQELCPSGLLVDKAEGSQDPSKLKLVEYVSTRAKERRVDGRFLLPNGPRKGPSHDGPHPAEGERSEV